MNPCKSDQKKLNEREMEATILLAKVGMDAGELTLQTAIDEHILSTDRDFKRALRVALAALRFTGTSHSDKQYQMELLRLDAAAYLASLPLSNHEVRNVLGAFVKAAHHRVDPCKHEAQGNK